MKKLVTRLVLGVALPLVVVAGAMATEQIPDTPRDPSAMCAEMMKTAGPDGEKAIPQAMAKMMDMARRMGDGDPMLGMTRMMEMMGDGMIGGHGGMMSPRDGWPQK